LRAVYSRWFGGDPGTFFGRAGTATTEGNVRKVSARQLSQ
jgi:hypothetical protein